MTGYKWAKITDITQDPDVQHGTSREGNVVTLLTGRLTIHTDVSNTAYPMFANGERITTWTMRRWNGKVDPAPWLSKINYNAD